MKVVLNVLVENLEDKINRYIEVDENISLQDLCEFIIVSMNGKNIPNYILKYRNITYYPWEGKAAINEKRINNIKLKDLKLKKGKQFDIDYNFDRLYRFNVVVDDIINSTNDSILM